MIRTSQRFSIPFYSGFMAFRSLPSSRDFTPASIVELLQRGSWSSVSATTIKSLISQGRVIEYPAVKTVYVEADVERLAVIVFGLLRVYMHAADGRQVTVRYVRTADLLGVPLVRPAETETTALGAAYLAGLAHGAWRGTDELAALWQAERRFTPTLDRAHAAERMARWEHAVRQASLA